MLGLIYNKFVPIYAHALFFYLYWLGEAQFASVKYVGICFVRATGYGAFFGIHPFNIFAF